MVKSIEYLWYTLLTVFSIQVVSSKEVKFFKNETSFMLISSETKLWRYYPNEPVKLVKVPLWGEYKIGQLAFNEARNEAYVHDLNRAQIGALDLSVQDTVAHAQWRSLVKSELGVVTGMVFEPNTGYLYWVDNIKGTLEVTSLDATENHWTNRAVLTRHLQRPVSLAFDAHNHRWVVGLFTVPCKIVTITMDGSAVQSVSGEATNGLALALSILPHADTLVVGDSVRENIHFSDGRNFVRTGQVHSITLFNSTSVYWTVLDSCTLYSLNLVTGAQRTINVITESQLRLPRHKECRIAPKVTAPKSAFVHCKYHQCAHLCLMTSKGNYRCACAQGYSTTDNGITCVVNSTAQFVSASTAVFDSIRDIHLWNHSDEPTHQPSFNWVVGLLCIVVACLMYAIIYVIHRSLNDHEFRNRVLDYIPRRIRELFVTRPSYVRIF